MEDGKGPGISRRAMIAGTGMAGAFAASASQGFAQSTAEPSPAFDMETDVVVCGGGAGGLASAVLCRSQDHEVVLLEKAGSLGGTAAKAAFWYWVPNNPAMKAGNIADPRQGFLQYVARLSSPDIYDPSSPTLGLDQWQYDMCAALYDSGADAVEALAGQADLPFRHVAGAPDYWAELAENKASLGRVLVPEGTNATLSDGGRVAIRNMTAAARRKGVRIATSHRVERLIRDGEGRVIGVEASRFDDSKVRIRARKAVIFATGGFTHNAAMRASHLRLPIQGGCAAPTNEGDILNILADAGVQLLNMKNAWAAPASLDKIAAGDGALIDTFKMGGDSMLIVNKYGHRVVDEKLPYNELAEIFGAWDAVRGEHPNLCLFSIWDERAQRKCASAEFGNLIVPEGTDNRHVIKGQTLEELASGIAARLASFRTTVSTQLDANFTAGLKASIDRFNALAVAGKDSDFGRGERIISKFFNGPALEANQPNATMWPLADTGPYYAALIVAASLDTKGGPKTDVDGKILDLQDKPIPGLYGVGNCVASCSGSAYWAGGATIGPILTFAYRAAQAISRENKAIPA
ncbi:FAD-dependent oxidoreductase [Sphingobium sp. 15-1]|uniref:FAD-dependent oxidoreductase n=1 Tax=Sphingobium sp. 15-1 TaxID=2729616 RepID=UPI001C3F6694|nr:FAD-dependent oxidoreductase [Sphingobium sp. 15-1]